MIAYIATLKELNMNNPRCNRGSATPPELNNPEGVEDEESPVEYSTEEQL
jgi:hypothetical protein